VLGVDSAYENPVGLRRAVGAVDVGVIRISPVVDVCDNAEAFEDRRGSSYVIGVLVRDPHEVDGPIAQLFVKAR
jgi:hypothetical protein